MTPSITASILDCLAFFASLGKVASHLGFFGLEFGSAFPNIIFLFFVAAASPKPLTFSSIVLTITVLAISAANRFVYESRVIR